MGGLFEAKYFKSAGPFIKTVKKIECKSGMGTTYLNIKPFSHWSEISMWHLCSLLVQSKDAFLYLLIIPVCCDHTSAVHAHFLKFVAILFHNNGHIFSFYF